ncbi:MAG TPA: YoaK family protein [Ilumatobacteraceae bacterium]|nr:YoaK family protein [Ilumatobacteraceae bacterium]
MTAEERHHSSGPLVVAVMLALTAGFVDAYVFLGVAPVFVANMSGNLIRLGLAIGARDGHALALSLVAITGFLSSAVVGSALNDVRVRHHGHPSAARLLTLETVALTALCATVMVAQPNPGTVTASSYLAILIGSTAMGLQAVSLRRVGSIAVSTTYGTGAIVRIGEKIALGLRRAERGSDVRRRATIYVIATILVGYVTGAAIAAAVDVTSRAWLVVPVIVCATAAYLAHRSAAAQARELALASA